MSSSGGGIGATITGGIQDIAAILPLLGTEQCSVQVSSALTRGYLYAAATPMSIFGSLGVVIAGFKTLIACFSFGNIEGARILGNMGFEPQGENLSLIMVEAGKGKKNTGRYIIETRMDELIKELDIDKNRITGVSHKSAAWNVKMMATTALFCVFSIAPYIYLNQGANSLDKSKPFPTCKKDNLEILRYKVLPLTRARDFLKIITSFAGLVEPFSNPGLSLYYTLTRKQPRNRAANAEKHKLRERTLYITVFDHKERTTRVYTRDNEMDVFYSTKSDAPLVDVGHFVLEVEIDAKIDAKSDPVLSSDSCILDSLRKHHRSILDVIQYRLGLGPGSITNTIENSWTMKVEDTISALKKLKEEGNGDDGITAVENEEERERNEESLLECDYFMDASIERERRLLDEKRSKWIARRMEMITIEMKERFLGMGVEYRVNKQAVEKKVTKSTEDIERLLIMEQYMMELLLVYEVNEWEKLFWNKFKAFLDQIGDDWVEVKERLSREWRANCWKRLSPQMHAAQKRMAELLSPHHRQKSLSRNPR